MRPRWFDRWRVRPKVCVTTAYSADFRSMGDIAAASVRLYAARHGFAVSVEPAVAFERHPAWYRIKLIEARFAEGFDFVLWIDADAVFVRYDESILSQVVPGRDLYLVRQTVPHISTSVPIPNTGVLLVRNTPWVHTLLRDLWNEVAYLDHPWFENAALIKLLGYRSLLGEGADVPDAERLAHIQFLPVEWNSLPRHHTAPDPIIRHYAGEPREVREREMLRDAVIGCTRALTGVRA